MSDFISTKLLTACLGTLKHQINTKHYVLRSLLIKYRPNVDFPTPFPPHMKTIGAKQSVRKEKLAKFLLKFHQLTIAFISARVYACSKGYKTCRSQAIKRLWVRFVIFVSITQLQHKILNI